MSNPSASQLQPALQQKTSLATKSKPPISVTRQDHARFHSFINSTLAKQYDASNAAADLGVDERNPWILFGERDARYRWDIFILILLIYVSTISVFVYSFVGALSISNPFFWIERILDVFFLVDIILNFFTTYDPYDSIEKPSLKSIAIQYLMTYFVFDLVGTFPWDVFGNRAEDTHTILEILRFVRLVRLVKLFRLVQMLRRRHSMVWLEVRFGLKYGYLRLITLVFSLMIIAHWVACLFYFFGSVPASTGDNMFPAWTENDEKVPADQYGRYMLSLYFSVYTITTIGYGDIVPTTTLERTYVTIIMFLGAACFAWAISQVSNIFGELREPSSIYRRRMDALTDFCNVRNLDVSLSEELRRHCQKYYSHRRVDSEQQELLHVLSHDLKLKTLRSIYEQPIQRLLALFNIEEDDSSFDDMYLEIEERFKVDGDRLYDFGDPVDGVYIIKEGTIIVTTEGGIQMTDQPTANNNPANTTTSVTINEGKKRDESDDTEQDRDDMPPSSTSWAASGKPPKPVGVPDTSDDEQVSSEVELHCGAVFASGDVIVERPRSSKAVVKNSAQLIFIPKDAVVNALKRNRSVWLNLRNENIEPFVKNWISVMQHHDTLAQASQELRNRSVGNNRNQLEDASNVLAMPIDSETTMAGLSSDSGAIVDAGTSSSTGGTSSELERLRREVQLKADQVKSLESQLAQLRRNVQSMMGVLQDGS